jgi:glycosyltransferase involved in cell wall biosynthesis
VLRDPALMISGNGPDCADGVAHFTERLLKELTRERGGTRWFWLNRRSARMGSPLSVADGITQLRPWHTWRPIARSLADLTMQALRPRVVHIQDQIHSFHETSAAVELARSAKRVGARVVVTLHEYHVELPSVRHTDDLVSLANVVIVQDQRNALRCRERTGRVPDAVGWSPSNVDPPPERPVSVPNRLVTFGLIGRAKGLEIVYEALRQVRNAHPQLSWHIWGPFEPLTNPYHRELQQRFSEPWVVFRGGPKDTSDLAFRIALAEATMMLLPFTDGASPRRTTLQAAWALQLPVITTVPEVPEPAIVGDENCKLVPGASAPLDEQIEAWERAIADALSSPAELARLREGSARAASAHSWARLGELHRAFYAR